MNKFQSQTSRSYEDFTLHQKMANQQVDLGDWMPTLGLIHPGDTGSAVKTIQLRLYKLGFFEGLIDGVYDNITARAVTAFQHANGLSSTGVIDLLTLQALGYDIDQSVPPFATSDNDPFSVAAVSQIFPDVPVANLQTYLPLILQNLNQLGLGDIEMVLMALATVKVETGNFAPIDEYQSAYNTAPGGAVFGLYDFRTDLGNSNPGDGARFKGRGFVQLTGRNNYNRYSQEVGLGEQLLQTPELANDPVIAARILAAYLKDHEGDIRDALSRGDLAAARKAVNKGPHGLDQFQLAFQNARYIIYTEELLKTKDIDSSEMPTEIRNLINDHTSMERDTIQEGLQKLYDNSSIELDEKLLKISDLELLPGEMFQLYLYQANTQTGYRYRIFGYLKVVDLPDAFEKKKAFIGKHFEVFARRLREETTVVFISARGTSQEAAIAQLWYLGQEIEIEAQHCNLWIPKAIPLPENIKNLLLETPDLNFESVPLPAADLSQLFRKAESPEVTNELVLSDEDLKYLQETPLHTTGLEDSGAVQDFAEELQDLIDTLRQLNPSGITFDQLMAIQAEEAAFLRDRGVQGLRFLQSPAIAKVLERLVAPYDNMVTPEMLRMLTSLLWNPAIYDSTPTVFFQTTPLTLKVDDASPVVGGVIKRVGSRVSRNKGSQVEHPKQVVNLQAHHLMDLCHRISPDGYVSLEQLREYQPCNDEEEKMVNLLRQVHIFQALAGLDDQSDCISDADIQLALAEGALVLSNPVIVLVMTP